MYRNIEQSLFKVVAVEVVVVVFVVVVEVVDFS